MLYKKRLMVPGPTPIPEQVIQAGMNPMIDERTEEFGKLFSGLMQNLKSILNTQNDILIFSSSITGACESTIQNLLCAGDHVLVINNGFFAERWIGICKSYGLFVHNIDFGFGNEIDFKKIKDVLEHYSEIKAAICVFGETSSGMMNDIEQFAKVTKPILSIVDAASGLGVSEIKTDDWGIDVVVSGSQKALMAPPGISFVSVSHKAWLAKSTATLPTFYFDWNKALVFSQDKYPHTPFTPAISLIYQLYKSTGMLLDEGLSNVYHRHRIMSQATKEALKSLNLKLIVNHEKFSSAVTAAFLPERINAEEFVEKLVQQYGIQITDGPGIYRDKIIRIGHCGYMDPFDIIATISAIETLLTEYGHEFVFGEAIQKAQKVFNDIKGIPAL